MRSGDEKLDPVPVRGLDGGVVAVVVVLDTTGGDAALLWLVGRCDSSGLLPVGVRVVCSKSLLPVTATDSFLVVCCGPKDPPPIESFGGEPAASPSSNAFAFCEKIVRSSEPKGG